MTIRSVTDGCMIVASYPLHYWMISSSLCPSRMAFIFTGFISRTASQSTTLDRSEGGRTKWIAGVTTNIGQRTTQMNDVRETSRKMRGKRRGTLNIMTSDLSVDREYIDVRAKRLPLRRIPSDGTNAM
eukprot:scaffold5065_cov134-Skeletonema_marinoi.AAC.5